MAQRRVHPKKQRSARGGSLPHPVQSVALLLQQLGKEEGIPVHIEPTWQHVGRITRRDGSVTYFRGAHFDLNGMGSMEIAVDKGYAAYFLEQAGYRVIPGKTFFSPTFAETLKSVDGPESAYRYIKEKMGFPVIVKPNSSTQGKLVTLVYDKRSCLQAVKKICDIDRVFLVQPYITGHDYRVVVLDGSVISAYERLPLTVVGDGRTSIAKLLSLLQTSFVERGRDTTIDVKDFRIDARLRRFHMNRKTVLKKGESFELLDNKNLSTGGSSIDVTDAIDPSYRELAVNIVRDMGLRYCGVDLMIDEDIRKPLSEENNYRVIEINAAPGVDHYSESGARQQKIVKELYRQILRKLAGVV